MSNVSSVTNHFSTANEGFVTTLGSTILSGAATVPLTSVSGLTNGSIFVGIIEPGTTGKEQTFTGTVDTGGNQITGVVWTRGTNTGHNAGVTIVDYVSGTGHNMATKGMLVEHAQDGTHRAITTTSITNAGNISQTDGSSITDNSSNELIKFSKTASAVNEVTVANAATGNGPTISATGTDTNIDLNLSPKGTGALKGINEKLYLPYKFRVGLTTATNTGNGAFGSAIPFNVEQYDTGSNVASGVFTAPITGYYQFNWNVQATLSSGADEEFISSLFIAGAEYSRGTEHNAQLVNASHGSDLVYMTAAQTADIRAFNTTTRAITATIISTYFSGYLVSAS